MSRLLLAAYPARLRRRHGAELIGTLAEMTDGRPTLADRLRLAGDGLLERFRLPVWKPVAILTAVAAMLTGGALGLLGGSLAGQAAHPSVPAVGPLVPQILGSSAQPVLATRADSVLAITASQATSTVPEIHTRLTAAGWDVGALQRDREQLGFRARSGDLHIDVQGYRDGQLEVLGYPVRPASYLPLVLGGLLLGLITGWLAGASLAHRLATSKHQLPAGVVAAIGAALLLIPAGRLYQGLYLYLTKDDGYGLGKLVHNTLAWIPAPFRDSALLPDTIAPGLRMLTIGLATIALAAVLARPAAEAVTSQ